MGTYLMFITVHNKLFQRKKKQGGGGKHIGIEEN